MTELLTIYNQVKKKYQYMPELIPGQLVVVETTKISQNEHDILEQLITDFKATSGWLSYQSKLVRYSSGDELSIEQDGWILQGELTDGLNSYHIRPSAIGGWLVTHLCDKSAEQQTGFIEHVSFIAVPEQEGDKDQRLNYQVYWEQDEALGYQKVLSRFTGFSDQEEQQ